MKKPILTFILILFCSLFLVSCEQKQKNATVTLSFTHGWGGVQKTHKIMQEIYEEFDRKNPDIVLDCIAYSTAPKTVENGNEMLTVGKMPDIIATNGLSYYLKNVQKTDLPLNLMPYIEENPEWEKNISPSIFENWTTGSGKLYTLPDALEVAGYWYNEDCFIKAGITDGNGNAKLPTSWKEFIKTTNKLQAWIDRTGQNISVFALDDIQILEFLFLARLAGEGYNGLRAAQNPYVKINYETLQNTLKDLKKIEHHATWVSSIENARQYFYDGESIIYFNGVWECEELKTSSSSQYLKYANYPTSDGRSLAYISPSSGYVVAAQEDENKTNAEIRFLKYMLSEEVQTRMAVETGQAPANPNIDMEQVIQKYPLFGNAIHQAYSADIQLKTIFSLWPTKKVEVVKQFLNQDVWAVDSTNEMLQALNEGIK